MSRVHDPGAVTLPRLAVVAASSAVDRVCAALRVAIDVLAAEEHGALEHAERASLYAAQVALVAQITRLRRRERERAQR